MLRLGFAICASFCSFETVFKEMQALSEIYDIVPIMSENAYNTDTRFGKAYDIRQKIKDITGKEIINSIATAEPLGPKNMVDMMLIAPCTGNTLGKLANGITDTAVTMAAKSCLRIGLPTVLCVATNDGLAASAQNIGRLINTKNIFFVPIRQDDPIKKPNSLVADFSKITQTLEKAVNKEQIQPVFS